MDFSVEVVRPPTQSILVVDVDSNSQAIADFVRENTQYQTAFSVDVNDAIEAARSKKTDLIVLSSCLPISFGAVSQLPSGFVIPTLYVGGMLALAEIKLLNPTQRVIVLSGSYQADTFELAHEHFGAEAVILKPVSPKRFYQSFLLRQKN